MKRWATYALAAILALGLASGAALAQEVKRLDKDTLKGWLGDPQLLLIDVRVPKDWKASSKKIKGAVRQDPKKADTWVPTLPRDKEIVLYCAWHNGGIDARVAEKLIGLGYKEVWILKGGWKEWEKAGYPTEAK